MKQMGRVILMMLSGFLSSHGLAQGLAEAEVVSLNKIITEINYLERLVKGARQNQDPGRRAQMDYNQLLLDLDRIRDGIADHLDKPWLSGREIRDIQPISGHYGAQQ